MKVDGLKSSVKGKYQKQKVLKVSNCHILVLSFPFAIGYLGLLQISEGHFIQLVWGDVEITQPGGQNHIHSLPQCTGRNAIPGLHQTPSASLLSEVDVVWIGCFYSTWACTLTQYLGFPHSHPSPQFFHKQSMKQCVCNVWCWARQMSLQILMQRVQSPLHIFHLSVRCWRRGGTGKQGPLWSTWQCRR